MCSEFLNLTVQTLHGAILLPALESPHLLLLPNGWKLLVLKDAYKVLALVILQTHAQLETTHDP